MNEQKQFLLVGLPFSGKTTLAREIENRLGFTRVNVDEIKQEFGYGDITDDKVSDEEWKRIFEELDNRIEKVLKSDKTILNEYAWITKEWRNRARNIASKLGIKTYVIFLDTPPEVVTQRWIENKKTHERFDVSEIDFNECLRDFEKPTEDENVIIYKNKENLDTWIKNNIENRL